MRYSGMGRRAVLWRRCIVQARGPNGESPSPTGLNANSYFGLFVRLIELHEYRRSACAD